MTKAALKERAQQCVNEASKKPGLLGHMRGEDGKKAAELAREIINAACEIDGIKPAIIEEALKIAADVVNSTAHWDIIE